MELNAYKIMWIFVFYDLPTETRVEQKKAAKFRKSIMEMGFRMFQFSIYTRFCMSKDVADNYIAQVRKLIPKDGKVGMLVVTDKQFSMMEIWYGRGKSVAPEAASEQLTFF
jgi:CRISPR-associated protein Cas2